MKKFSVMIVYLCFFAVFCFAKTDSYIQSVDVSKENEEVTIGVNFSTTGNITDVWNLLVNPEKLMNIYNEYESITVNSSNDHEVIATYVIKIPFVKTVSYILRTELDEAHQVISWSLVSSDRLEKYTGTYKLVEISGGGGTELYFKTMVVLHSKFLNFFKNLFIKDETVKSVERLVNYIEKN